MLSVKITVYKDGKPIHRHIVTREKEKEGVPLDEQVNALLDTHKTTVSYRLNGRAS